jgi:prevent-host-death family protein
VIPVRESYRKRKAGLEFWLNRFPKVVIITTLGIMQKTISAAEANRKFSEVLRGVREGQSYVVTSHGRPVARIEPVNKKADADLARAALLKRLRAQKAIDIGPWTRDELYD